MKITNASLEGLKEKDYVKFVDLYLQTSKVDFGMATISGVASGYEIIPKITNEKPQLKLNINDGK